MSIGYITVTKYETIHKYRFSKKNGFNFVLFKIMLNIINLNITPALQCMETYLYTQQHKDTTYLCNSTCIKSRTELKTKPQFLHRLR